MMLIVGLGNSGKEYSKNRHNIGFHCIDYLAKQYSITVKKNQCQALIGNGVIDDKAALLVKPKTYVNNSGLAVAGLMKKHNIPISRLIVIYDDMDLPLGKIRIRQGGSAGGHKGIKSIISCSGSQDFTRIKIGIGRPEEEANRNIKNDRVVNHVLSDFTPDEYRIIKPIIERISDAIESIISLGIEATMNKFN
jgi:peptidyl-tRNA hydrolase, PTH1 family